MNGECSICDVALENGDNQVLLTTCNHVFHIVCMVRWFQTAPAYRDTCPQCRGSMNICNFRIIQSNMNCDLANHAQSTGSSNRLVFGKCSTEWITSSSIIENFQAELAELENEGQRLEEEKRHLEEKMRRFEEEKRHLEEEKRRLDEEKRRLEEELCRLEEIALQEQHRIETVVVFALLMIILFALCFRLKCTFSCTLM